MFKERDTNESNAQLFCSFKHLNWLALNVVRASEIALVDKVDGQPLRFKRLVEFKRGKETLFSDYFNTASNEFFKNED